MATEKVIKRDKITGQVDHISNESLMLFEKCTYLNKDFRIFYGIGKVYRVVNGDENDLVYINFGLFPEHRVKALVVFYNHARRQTLLLKRGQVCQVYGLARYIERDVTNKAGHKEKKLSLVLYAHGFNAWYIPTLMDIRKMPKNEDLVSPTDKEKEYMESMEDILDQFKTTGEVEDE